MPRHDLGGFHGPGAPNPPFHLRVHSRAPSAAQPMSARTHAAAATQPHCTRTSSRRRNPMRCCWRAEPAWGSSPPPHRSETNPSLGHCPIAGRQPDTVQPDEQRGLRQRWPHPARAYLLRCHRLCRLCREPHDCAQVHRPRGAPGRSQHRRSMRRRCIHPRRRCTGQCSGPNWLPLLVVSACRRGKQHAARTACHLPRLACPRGD